jgi:hypothetical protein
MKVSTENHKRQLSNIYDILKGIAIGKSLTEWERLSLKHAKEAKRDFKKFIYDKDIELDLDYNYIKIGKCFILKLTDTLT